MSSYEARQRSAVHNRSPPTERTLGLLTASASIAATAWIPAALRDFDYTVGSIVPPVFDAYARVFHPAFRRAGDNKMMVLWADVAQANDREMHAAAEWGSITGSWEYQHRLTQPGVWDTPPSTGELPWEVARRLVATLAEHTADPDHNFFAVWEGWGTGTAAFFFAKDTPEEARQQMREVRDAEITAWRELIESAAAFQVPHRKMHLLRGPLAAIEDFYERYNGRSSLCLRNPPSLWWPADMSWCVGTDIDLMTTYIGGSTAVVDALLANDQLEVWRVSDDQGITWEADTVNPLPTPR